MLRLKKNLLLCLVSAARMAISNISAVPHDDRSLLVRWSILDSSGLTGFVVEWTPLLDRDLSLTQFEITARNQTSLLITGMLYSICKAGFQLRALLI